MPAHFACSSPCLPYLFFPTRACRARPNETCRRELAIWRLSGLSSPIPAASEAQAHAVGSLCLFTVIRYSFSGTPIRVSIFQKRRSESATQNINEFVYTVVDPEFFLQFVYPMRSVFLIIFSLPDVHLSNFFSQQKSIIALALSFNWDKRAFIFFCGDF